MGDDWMSGVRAAHLLDAWHGFIESIVGGGISEFGWTSERVTFLRYGI